MKIYQLIDQVKILSFKKTSQKQTALKFCLNGLSILIFESVKVDKKIIGPIRRRRKNLKSFSITPPSECRMSAKSTFLVIDINYMLKQAPQIGDKH